MQAIFFKVFRWLLDVAQIKFVTFTAIFGIFNYFATQLIEFINNSISVNALTSSFTSLPPSVWFFINAFNLTYGLPLLLGAFVTRFLIRRIPIIG